MATISLHSITFDYAAVFKKRKCIVLLRLLHGAICAITLSESQWFSWFCCQKVPPLSWCRALPLLLVLSPPTSAGSPLPCWWCKLPPAVTAGRLCGSCTAVTAAECLPASQRPLVCHRTVRLCTNCRCW